MTDQRPTSILFDDPTDRETAYDRLDPSFATGENLELEARADQLIASAEREARGACDFCGIRGESRFSVRDAYARTYFRVCGSCAHNTNPTQAPRLARWQTKPLERWLSLQSELEQLIAQEGYIVRTVSVEKERDLADGSRRRPAQSDETFALALMGEDDRRRKREDSRRRRAEAKRKRLWVEAGLARQAEAEAVLVRVSLVVYAWQLGRTLESLLMARGTHRRVVDLQLLASTILGFQASALERATGYAPHQIRDSLIRARGYLELAA